MKTLKIIAIAAIAGAFAAPSFAGGDAAQLAAQKRAYELRNTPNAAAGGSAVARKVSPALNLGHPSTRVRR